MERREIEIADLGPTSKLVNGHARVDEALPLLYSMQVLYKIKLWDKANNRCCFRLSTYAL